MVEECTSSDWLTARDVDMAICRRTPRGFSPNVGDCPPGSKCSGVATTPLSKSRPFNMCNKPD